MPIAPNIAQINMENVVLLSDRSLCIILFSLLIRISAVDQRLGRANDNRVFAGSKLAEAIWTLLQFPFTPFCQCLSEETLKAVGPYKSSFLSFHQESCPLNCALPVPGTADGDVVSRCQVLGRAGSVHHGADQ